MLLFVEFLKSLLYCSVFLENFDHFYKDFFLKITIGNFGLKIWKILGNFCLGLGPDLGLKFGPSPNRKFSIIRPQKNTDVQWSAKILTSAARCRAQHVMLKFTVMQEKYHIGYKLYLIQATVLKLIKQPAMMKSLLGVVLLEMDEFPIVLAMLIISFERYTLNKKRTLNHHP